MRYSCDSKSENWAERSAKVGLPYDREMRISDRGIPPSVPFTPCRVLFIPHPHPLCPPTLIPMQTP